MKILVSAYACEPDKGSEPGVGWNWAIQMGRFYEVWVVTRTNNRRSIEQSLALNPQPNVHFHYVDVPRWLSFWKKGQSGIYPYYFLWQLWAYFVAKKLHKAHSFSIVQHLTFGTIWLPTFMPFLGAPFVWGPIGGAEIVPKVLRPHLSTRWRFYERLRDVILAWTLCCDPLTKIAMKRAKFIIARTQITYLAFPAAIREKTRILIETGVDREFLDKMSKDKEVCTEQIVLMSGRLLHWKGFDMGIAAFAKIADKFPQAQLVIVGSGPEEHRLKSLASTLSGSQKIVFKGQLPREEALGIMRKATIFLMPSMKDAGAWVLFEAMASALPIICLNYAGPREIVDDSCAIRVNIGERAVVIQEISEGLIKLLSSESLIKNMGQASLERLENHFLWDRKINTVVQWLDDIHPQYKDK